LYDDIDDNRVEQQYNTGLVTIQNGVTASRISYCIDATSTVECIANNGYIKRTQTHVVVNESDANTRTCHARSLKREDNKWNVETAPMIHMWTDGRFERLNAVVQLYCRAYARPPPVVYWTHENGTIVDNDGSTYQTLSNGDLLIMANSGAASGQYTCHAVNEHGKDNVHSYFYATMPEDAPDQ